MLENCPQIIPQQTVQKIVVLLHGYGSNGDDLIEIAKIWQPNLPNTAFFSPNAIEKSEVNPFGGYQWFGLNDFNPTNIRAGLDKAKPHINRFLKSLLAEYRLLPSDLIIAGFSQGAMLALDMIYSIARLGGIIGYSGAFYPPSNNTAPLSSVPILLVHGTSDMVVPYASLQLAQNQLRKVNINVMTQTCPGLGHSIDEAGLMAGLDFIKYQHQNQPIAL